jgi:hypothetical protein
MSRYKGRKPRLHWPVVKRDKKDKAKSNNANIRLYHYYQAFLQNNTVEQLRQGATVIRTRSRTGYSNPRYKEQIRDVVSATTDFDAVDISVITKPYKCHSKRKIPAPTQPEAITTAGAQSIYYKNCPVSFPSTPPPYSGTAYTSAFNLAVGRLYDKIRTFESSSNIGEDLGEISQTIGLLRKPLAGFQDLLRHTVEHHHDVLKKALLWNSAKRVAKALGSVVVEYRYGVEPLIRSVASATVALQNRTIMTDVKHFSVSGKAVASPDVERWDEVEGACGFSGSVYTAQEYKVRFKGVYKLNADIDSYSFHRSLGLTWNELIPTLYNLIPYSFLLDYVINFNQFVSRLAVPWSNVAWCNRTERAMNVHRRDAHHGYQTSGSDFAISDFTPGFINVKVTGIRRRDQTQWCPMPFLQVISPTNRHLENVAALLASKLPVIGALTKSLSRSRLGSSVNSEFRLASRGSMYKVPYPQFTF